MQHTEAQDGNLILGGPQEDPDLADVLRDPAADARQEAGGSEAPADATAAHGSMQLASIPEGSEQAAQPGAALGRKGRASAPASMQEQHAQPGQPEPTAGKPRGSGRRKRRAPVPSTAEEAAAIEQPSKGQSTQAEVPKAASGGRRRRRASDMPLSPAEEPAHRSGQAAGHSRHAGSEPQTAGAATVDQQAQQLGAVHDQVSDQGVASHTSTNPKVARALCICLTCWTQVVSRQAASGGSAKYPLGTTESLALQEGGSNGAVVSEVATQIRQDLPRPAAGRRKRHIPVSAALPDASGAPGTLIALLDDSAS